MRSVRKPGAVFLLCAVMFFLQGPAAAQVGSDVEDSGSGWQVAGGVGVGLVAGLLGAAGTAVAVHRIGGPAFSRPPWGTVALAGTIFVGGTMAGGIIGHEDRLGPATVGFLVGTAGGALVSWGAALASNSTAEGKRAAAVAGAGIGALAGFLGGALLAGDDDDVPDTVLAVRAPLLVLRF